MTETLISPLRPFAVEQTHGMLQLSGVSEQESSDGFDWRSMYVSTQGELPFRGSFYARDPLMVFHRRPVSGFVDLKRRDGVSVPAGSIRFVAPNRPFDVELSQPTETVHLYIRQEVWDEVVMDMTGRDSSRVQFDSRVVLTEPVLFALCNAAVASMRMGVKEPSLTDHLSRSIAAHALAAHFGIRPSWQFSPTNARISPEVARAIDYINANFDRSIGLQEIADAAYRSASHLARVFATETGMPPHRYLIDVRLRRAQRLLARTDMPIAQIAFECGFSHQEHLTRTFRRLLQTTPAAYRREAAALVSYRIKSTDT